MANKLVLSGSNIPVFEDQTVYQEVSSTQVLTISLQLRLDSKLGFDEAVKQAEQVPPHKRVYLGRDRVLALLTPSQADVDTVSLELSANGFTNVELNQKTLLLDATGTVGQINDFFDTKLCWFNEGSMLKSAYRGPLSIPCSLQGIVHAVLGLEVRCYRLEQSSSSSCQCGPYKGPYSPQDMMGFYNFPPQDGEGQVVGVIEIGGGFFQEDLDTFFESINMPVPQIEIAGMGLNTPGTLEDGVKYMTKCEALSPLTGMEYTMDVELLGSYVNKARMKIYSYQHYSLQPQSNGPEGYGELMVGFNQLFWLSVWNLLLDTEEELPPVVSCSDAAQENEGSIGLQLSFNRSLKALAVLRGLTFCISSGDMGSNPSRSNPSELMGYFPSNSPYVLACGGTTLFSAGSIRTKENVWNTPWPCGPAKGRPNASAGGVSTTFKITPDWQHTALTEEKTGLIGRALPDVAAVADASSGTFVYYAGMFTSSGGTSASAPLWAALLTRINQGLGTKRLGHITPLLYDWGVARTFNQITEGSNHLPAATVGAYQACAGWNPCTGLGSPNGVDLQQALYKLYCPE